MQNYPVESKVDTSSIMVFLCTFWQPIYMIVEVSRGREPGFPGFILSVVLGIMAISSLATIKQNVYVVNCPYCNEKTDFPVTAQGVNCSCCEKRIIMKNGFIAKSEE